MVSNERTRLLLATNSVAVGGMEEHVRLIAQEIDRAQYVVHAAMPRWTETDEFAQRLAERSDQFHELTPDRRHGVVAWIRETARVVIVARRHRFDVAHLHGTSYHGCTSFVLGLWLARVRRIFLTEHLAPYGPVSERSRRIRRLVTRRLTGLIAVSINNRDARLAHLGDPGCPFHVVNNGIDPSRFDEIEPGAADAVRSELQIAADATVVGSAIRLEPDKGVDDLIEAFASVHARRPSTVLLLVGTGSIADQLRDRAAELGLADAVVFAGYRADPRPFIRAIDVFVLPVPSGSASIALLEAMAMERACVITFGGRKEAVEHGISGYCAEPNDPVSLADHISRLVESPARRAEFGRQARRRIDRDYSAERVARELESLYRPEGSSS